MAARGVLLGAAAMIVACGHTSGGTSAKADASDGPLCLGQENADPSTGLQCETSYFGVNCTCGGGLSACVCGGLNPIAVPFDGCPCCPSAEMVLSICGDASGPATDY